MTESHYAKQDARESLFALGDEKLGGDVLEVQVCLVPFLPPPDDRSLHAKHTNQNNMQNILGGTLQPCLA